MEKCLALVLVQGRRCELGALFASAADPAGPVGGRYRPLDFAVTNSIRSSLGPVVLLGEAQQTLRDYAQQITRASGAQVAVQPCSAAALGRGWAAALDETLARGEYAGYEHVLVLYSERVYRMDYAQMLQEHERSGADVTMAQDRAGQLVGAYLLRRGALLQALECDRGNELSAHDVERSLIPAMRLQGYSVQPYRLAGRFFDASNARGLWQANMALLDKDCFRELLPRNAVFAWPGQVAPHRMEGLMMRNGLLGQGCVIFGHVEDSVLGSDVIVDVGAQLRGCVLLDGAYIGPGVQLRNAIIGARAQLFAAPEQVDGSVAVVGVGARVSRRIPAQQDAGS